MGYSSDKHGKLMEEEFRAAWGKATEESYQNNLQALRNLPDPDFSPIQLRINPWVLPMYGLSGGTLSVMKYLGRRDDHLDGSDYWGHQGDYREKEFCDRETGCGGITCKDCDDINKGGYHG